MALIDDRNSTPDARKAQASSYRPDIDGLRALAVVPVLLYHANLGCPGGFVGVDIFFVISGYLITSLLLREIDAGHLSMITFWERRIRRILPALMVVILATLVAGWFLYLPRDFQSVSMTVIMQALLSSNIHFAGSTDYFSPGSDTLPLLHTWSLAVEEQFYLFFPLLLATLLRRENKTVFKIILMIALASLALSAFGTRAFPRAAFYLLPWRAWELLLGTLLAMLSKNRVTISQNLREIAGIVGIVCIFVAFIFFNHKTRFPGIAALLPCAGAALIILSSEEKLSRVGKVLALRPVVFVGLISYSLYLWHWPVLNFSKYQMIHQDVWLRIALLVLSLLLAIVTWKFVETPIRKKEWLAQRSQIFRFAGVCFLVCVVLGLVINIGKGFPSHFSPEILHYADFRSHREFQNDITLTEARAGKFVELGSQQKADRVFVMIWGDSHAMGVTAAIDDLCRQYSRRGVQATHSSVPPVMGGFRVNKKRIANPAEYANAIFNFIAENKVQNVVLAARWSNYAPSETFEKSLLGTIDELLKTGTRVFVLRDVPRPGFDVPRIVAMTAMRHGNIERLGITPLMHQQANADLESMFNKVSQTGAILLEPADYFLNSTGLYGVIKNDQVLYYDENHLTTEGAKMLTPLFEPMFREK